MTRQSVADGFVLSICLQEDAFAFRVQGSGFRV